MNMAKFEEFCYTISSKKTAFIYKSIIDRVSTWSVTKNRLLRIIGFLWLVLTTLHKPLSCTNFYKPLVVWNELISKNLLQACDTVLKKSLKSVELLICILI